MRLEDMLKDISGITNQVVKTNCFDGQNTLLDSILLLQTKMNEVIQAINDGIIKGDKGDTPNVQVGNTETLEPGNNASVTQTGDILNPILNFAIPKGEKGDKGDTGKASESIQDDVISLDTTWSSTKVDSLFKNIVDTQGLEYITENNFYPINSSKNGVITDIKLDGKTLVVDDNNNVVIPGTQGATLKSVGDGVTEIKLNGINYNLWSVKNVYYGDLDTSNGQQKPTANGIITTDNLIPVSYGSLFAKAYDKDGFNSSYSFFCYDFNKQFLGVVTGTGSSTVVLKSGTNYIRARITKPNFNVIDKNTLKVYIGYSVKSSFDDNIKNIKKVLYKDTDGTWKKPTLRQLDSIEKHSDGKYYYHKRSDVYTFNGTESWGVTGTDPSSGTNELLFYLRKITNGKNNGDCVSDKFTRQGSPYFFKGECFVAVQTDGQTYVRIAKSKLSTQDVQGFKTWLQNNNLNTVYELAQEQVFECTPIDLISYDAQTNYSIECGPIYPKSTLYINSDYGNVLSNIVRRMTQIEEDRIEDRKALIRGDFRLLAEKTYPDDFIKKEELPNE